jgi:hypothetical protein
LVLGLWDMQELINSNNNLKTVEFKEDISKFVVSHRVRYLFVFLCVLDS